ncbi:MAG: hypothetical protein A2504_02570 [Bdellovibrionales bacterium RIFOXYD12_FULL_39_22]|nr:MAG: hypothetical protein A2385_12600 [Bdellovibrionales bacterium RIFOXYB1_FULL_39_21]OFZ41188.1 MAG: hypothetical protein A2485_01010 [Bdellovibrionales bacterium RIFOXYC12_FULL_39_17]OFZ44942.1 MAG: hypothetical protein A2404_11755 [Bdellovibrionales bacterium RIFOXYC1_FULL_39_130]OFZ74389.1 MAG: hypothetical protein A2560_12125 [Bdellovibrionales bacterium RIFOXYD1_FULL_39_84]OFZ92391.1 MAG: hypothetical protein A2504_02570 [Bdellovibrionales bacterium RIFOXYD12_FULL_39_22]HLE10719.1 ch
MSDQNDYNERLIRVFAEEAQEFIAALDKNFEFLDSSQDLDMLYPIIGDIFRIIHSLKASTATLGYNNMTKFVHSLESALELIKSKKTPLNSETINLMFAATSDIKNDLTYLITNQKDVPDKIGSEAANAVTRLQSGTGMVTATSAVAVPLPSVSTSSNPKPAKYFQLILRLDPELFTTGTDPLYLIQELKAQGEIINISCNTDMIPEVDRFDFEKLYLSWEIILKTTVSEEQLMAVFVFVKGRSDIKIFDVSGRYTEAGHEKLISEKRIGDILIARGKVDEETVAAVAETQQRMGDILIAKNKVSEEDVQKALADQENARKNIPTTVRVDIEKLDSLVNLIGELIINESRLRTLAQDISDSTLRRLMVSQCEETSRIVNDLQDRAMNTRMVPVDSVFSQFHRMVRDLSKKQGKNIRLVLTGQETELDKNIIEQINNPLKHLVRNSIDHGIEMPEERTRLGKAAEAIVHLKAYQKEGGIFIEISDDGKGLDREAILQKAIEKGLIEKNEAVTDDQIYQMIFRPGFSTAKVVTDVSGRGVGMDVVKRAISELRGSIDIHTERGVGTSFVIRLPLTLAIIDGLLFRVGNEIFIIPLLAVNEIFRPRREQIRTIEGKGEFVNVRGKPNSLIRLGDILLVAGAEKDPTNGLILNIDVDHKKYSLLVDEIIGQQQVVLKSLEENYEKTAGLSGATILGNGRIAAIIDPSEMVALFKNSQSSDSVLVFHSSDKGR